MATDHDYYFYYYYDYDYDYDYYYYYYYYYYTSTATRATHAAAGHSLMLPPKGGHHRRRPKGHHCRRPKGAHHRRRKGAHHRRRCRPKGARRPKGAHQEAENPNVRSHMFPFFYLYICCGAVGARPGSTPQPCTRTCSLSSIHCRSSLGLYKLSAPGRRNIVVIVQSFDS